MKNIVATAASKRMKLTVMKKKFFMKKGFAMKKKVVKSANVMKKKLVFKKKIAMKKTTGMKKFAKTTGIGKKHVKASIGAKEKVKVTSIGNKAIGMKKTGGNKNAPKKAVKNNEKRSYVDNTKKTQVVVEENLFEDPCHEILQEMDTQMMKFDDSSTQKKTNNQTAQNTTSQNAIKKFEDPGQRQNQYMDVIHKIEEKITTQPKNMPKDVKMMPHQLEALEWAMSIYNNNVTGGLLGDEMGLGKTMEMISVLAHVHETKFGFGSKGGCYLVVCPKSVVKNWEREILRFYPELGEKLVEVTQTSSSGGKSEKNLKGCFVCYEGSREEKEELDRLIEKKLLTEENPHLVILTNYEQISSDKNFTLHKPSYDITIVDEGHRLKTPENAFPKAMNTVIKTHTRFAITGTPMQNNVRELWALLNFLIPELFNDEETFKTWFTAPFSLKDIEKSSNVAEKEKMIKVNQEREAMLLANLHAMLTPIMLQRTKAEVFGTKLPPLRVETIRIKSTPYQRKYLEFVNKYKIEIKNVQTENTLAKFLLPKKIMRCRKMALHPLLMGKFAPTVVPALENSKTNSKTQASTSSSSTSTTTLAQQNDSSKNDFLIALSGKFEMLDRSLKKLLAGGHKVLIFSQFTMAMDLMEKLFAQNFPNLVYGRIDGQESLESRQDVVNKFAEETCKTKLQSMSSMPSMDVILLSTRAGGVGLNLQAADTVIMFDQDWNPQNDKQALARAWRIGQKNDVLVLKFISDDPVEEYMEMVCEEKLELEQKLIGTADFSGSIRLKKNFGNDKMAMRKQFEAVQEAIRKTAANKKFRGNHNGLNHEESQEWTDSSGPPGGKLYNELNDIVNSKRRKTEKTEAVTEVLTTAMKVGAAGVNGKFNTKQKMKNVSAALEEWNNVLDAGQVGVPLHTKQRNRKPIVYDNFEHKSRFQPTGIDELNGKLSRDKYELDMYRRIDREVIFANDQNNSSLLRKLLEEERVNTANTAPQSKGNNSNKLNKLNKNLAAATVRLNCQILELSNRRIGENDTVSSELNLMQQIFESLTQHAENKIPGMTYLRQVVNEGYTNFTDVLAQQKQVLKIRHNMWPNPLDLASLMNLRQQKVAEVGKALKAAEEGKQESAQGANNSGASASSKTGAPRLPKRTPKTANKNMLGGASFANAAGLKFYDIVNDPMIVVEGSCSLTLDPSNNTTPGQNLLQFKRQIKYDAGADESDSDDDLSSIGTLSDCSSDEEPSVQ